MSIPAPFSFQKPFGSAPLRGVMAEEGDRKRCCERGVLSLPDGAGLSVTQLEKAARCYVTAAQARFPFTALNLLVLGFLHLVCLL